jgi:hypothetical protein
MNTSYLAGLDKLLAETAKRGDLDAALAIQNERARITEKKEPTEAELRAMPSALRAQRAGYDATRKRIDDETLRRNLIAERTYLAELEALQKRITMAGDIDQALIVKAERDLVLAKRAEATALGSIAKEPAGPTKPPAPTGPEVAKVVGTWIFESIDGKSRLPRYLIADGTLYAKKHGSSGRWKLDNGKVVLTYPDRTVEEMVPPLDPAGTDVMFGNRKSHRAVWQGETTVFPIAGAPASSADAATMAAVKALITNSRWGQVPGGDLKAPLKHWLEFYRDGSGSTSWGRRPSWEIIPPKTLHIYDPYEGKQNYYEIDVAKKLALPSQEFDRGVGMMRYMQRVNTPPRSGR